MRIPFPERLPLFSVAVFGVLVCVVQLLLGTGAYFSVCCFAFIMIAAFAFNLAGGFTRPSGAAIFFYAVLTSIFSWVVKDILLEPGDSNLLVPNLTVSTYVGTITAMTIGVFFAKKITTKKALLGQLITEENARTAVVGCVVVGTIVTLAVSMLHHEAGSVMAILAQINNFILLGIAIGTTHEVKASGGRRSTTPTIIIAMIVAFIFSGLVTFSKEAMFGPPVCYLVAAASVGYRFSRKQVFWGACLVYVMLHWMVPYSQYGRNYKSEAAGTQAGFVENLTTAVTLLGQLGFVREEYLRQTAQDNYGRTAGYYNESQEFFDRLSMFSPDDALISATEDGKNEYGLYPLWYAIYNIVPHFIWPEKPSFMFGNLYAHEAGMLGAEDFGTGISFSAAAQSYHMAGWTGVILIATPIYVVFFAFFDSLCGDVRKTPWGIPVLAFFAHAAPEGMLDHCLGDIWHFGFPLVGAAMLCAYVMPIIGTMVIGPPKKMIEVSDAVIGRPRRMIPGSARPSIPS